MDSPSYAMLCLSKLNFRMPQHTKNFRKIPKFTSNNIWVRCNSINFIHRRNDSKDAYSRNFKGKSTYPSKVTKLNHQGVHARGTSMRDGALDASRTQDNFLLYITVIT